MKISILKQEGLTQNFKVVVPAADFSKMINEKLIKLGKNVKIDGFRPGKVPANILKQRYMGDALSQTVDKVIDDAVKQIYAEHKIRQADTPSVDIQSVEPETDLEFTIAVETLPEIEIKAFDGIKLERPTVKTADDEVEARLQKDAESSKKLSDLKKERAAKSGDFVELSVVAKLNDKVVEDFPKMIKMTLGEELSDILPNVTKAAIGLNKGESATVDESFSGDISVKSLKGKTASLTITVNEIKAVETHKVDEEFAKQMGYETVEEMRKAVREDMEKKHAWLGDMYVKRHLLDALSEQYTFELPAKMLEKEFNDIWARLKEEIEESRANGTLDPDDDKPEEELKKEYRGIAERRIRLGLLISEIANKNDIRLTTDDMRRALYQEVMKAPEHQEQIVNFFKKNPGALERLSAPILEDKVVSFILESAKVKEREMDMPAFRKLIAGVIPGFFDDEEEVAEAEGKKPAKAKVKKSKG